MRSLVSMHYRVRARYPMGTDIAEAKNHGGARAAGADELRLDPAGGDGHDDAWQTQHGGERKMLGHDIDEVIALLDGIISEHRGQNSPRALFPALYRSVTWRVRERIRRGEFEDGARMDRFGTVFANRYFSALAALGGEKPPPRAWRAAFDAERRSGVMVLQHILLGMNAHINFDLPLATLEVAGGRDVRRLERDFLAINSTLVGMLEPAQEIVGRFSPLLDILDRVGGRTDEALLTFSLLTARDEAWYEAVRLEGEADGQRERSSLSLDRRVALLADRIIVPGGPLGLAIELISRTEKQDVPAIADALLEWGTASST